MSTSTPIISKSALHSSLKREGIGYPKEKKVMFQLDETVPATSSPRTLTPPISRFRYSVEDIQEVDGSEEVFNNSLIDSEAAIPIPFSTVAATSMRIPVGQSNDDEDLFDLDETIPTSLLSPPAMCSNATIPLPIPTSSSNSPNAMGGFSPRIMTKYPLPSFSNSSSVHPCKSSPDDNAEERGSEDEKEDERGEPEVSFTRSLPISISLPSNSFSKSYRPAMAVPISQGRKEEEAILSSKPKMSPPASLRMRQWSEKDGG
jgi:hypothetical protein